MFDRMNKANPVQDGGGSVYVGDDRRAGVDMTPQSEVIFYVLIGLLFLPFGIAYACYFLYRSVHDRFDPRDPPFQR